MVPQLRTLPTNVARLRLRLVPLLVSRSAPGLPCTRKLLWQPRSSFTPFETRESNRHFSRRVKLSRKELCQHADVTACDAAVA